MDVCCTPCLHPEVKRSSGSIVLETNLLWIILTNSCNSTYATKRLYLSCSLNIDQTEYSILPLATTHPNKTMMQQWKGR